MRATTIQDSALAKRLQRETSAEVLFDDFSRGLYSTDASIYQVMPLGVVVPKTQDDVKTTSILRMKMDSSMIKQLRCQLITFQ